MPAPNEPHGTSVPDATAEEVRAEAAVALRTPTEVAAPTEDTTPPVAEEVVSLEELEALRQRNIRGATKLLHAVNLVSDMQSRWKDEVEELIRREVLQDDAHRALPREVYTGEAESAMNPKYIRWMLKRSHAAAQHDADDCNDPTSTFSPSAGP